MKEMGSAQKWSIALWWLIMALYQMSPIRKALESNESIGHAIASRIYEAIVIVIIVIMVGLIRNSRLARGVAASLFAITSLAIVANVARFALNGLILGVRAYAFILFIVVANMLCAWALWKAEFAEQSHGP